MAYWIMNNGPGGGWLMKRTAVMASSLAGALVAALFTGPTAASMPAAATSPASAVPGVVPTAWPTKKPARGVLRVKVTGTGSYTIRAKGLRKTSTVTKTFRVKPGKYTVKAPGATVKPKKTVRVRNGKTATVRVRFPKTTPAPGPEPKPPVQPPVTGPVSQWVQAGTEATVSTAGGYAIHIPAGVLQQSAMVSVTPLDPAPGGLPGAAFHIAGAWSGSVQVTLPIPDTSDAPVVLHEASDGLRITSGGGAQRGTTEGVPTVTASVNSLSTFYSAGIDCGGVSEVARGLLCADQTDRALADWLTAAGAQAASAVQANKVSAAAESSDCPNSNAAMPSSGDLAKGLTCSESLSGAWGEWGFTNGTHASYLGGLYSAGAVYTMDVSGSFDRSVDRPDDIPLILWPLYEPLKDWYVFPKQKTKIRKTTGSGPSIITTDPDPGVTPLWASTGFLTGLVGGELIDDLLKDANINLAAQISTCMPQGSTSLSSSVVNCVKTALIEALKYYAKKAPLAKKARAAGALAKILSAGDVLMIGASFWLALEAKIGGGLENHLTLEKIEPDLGVDPPTHPKTTNTYIARDPDTGRSVLVDRGRITTIGTGTLFNCLARTRAVWDISNLKALKQTADGAQLSCYDEGPEWTYTPTAQGGNTGTNIILRDSATPGHNWLINSAGEIQTIEDGGTYLCLAATNPVLWNTPSDKINAWTPVGQEVATCGGSGTLGPLTRITTPDPDEQVNGATLLGQFSPDGEMVAFFSEASNLTTDIIPGTGLFVLDIKSGEVRRIASSDQHVYSIPRWSPDSRELAFVSAAPDLVPGDTNSVKDVFVIDLTANTVERVSTDQEGGQADRSSGSPDWSPDGTKIVFHSQATNLVPGDTNGDNGFEGSDVFVKNMATGDVQRISVTAAGAQLNGNLLGVMPRWAPDGEHVAFLSWGDILADQWGLLELYVKDITDGSVVRASTDANGGPPPFGGQACSDPGHMCQGPPEWSPDGRISFVSSGAFVQGDTNLLPDLYVKNLGTGRVTWGSSANGAATGGVCFLYGECQAGAWSPDGSRVAFASFASDLVPGDTNGTYDVFVKELSSGAVQRVSTGSGGQQANGASLRPHWSPDGTQVMFDSTASNLVPGDTNAVSDTFIKTLQ